MASSTGKKSKLSSVATEDLLNALETRFLKNMHRHSKANWQDISIRLRAQPVKLKSLHAMENTGGEPDVVTFHTKKEEIVFYDCSPETPKGRRSVCFDHHALAARKEHKPANSAVGMAEEMGIEILSEEQYRELQSSLPAGEKLDTKTSSWLATPADIRKLGGAIFGDYRYGKVFIYHNGAESYYAARGFRGSLKV